MKNKKYFGLKLVLVVFLIILLVALGIKSFGKNTNILGKVEGKICYPSDFIPAGFILAKNIKTNEIKEISFDDKVIVGSQGFSIQLEKGTYVFAYKPILVDGSGYDYEGVRGFYTQCALNTEHEICSKPESHKLIEVEVGKNKTTGDISICDYYYGDENKPNF